MNCKCCGAWFSSSDASQELCAGCRRALERVSPIIKSLSAELKQVKRERDAAVEDLEMLADCKTCIHDDDEACDHCCDVTTRGNWQWVGVKESSDA